MATKQVHLKMGPTGRGELTIDGENVTNVRSVHLESRVGELTRVTLELVNTTLEYDGDAAVFAETTGIASENREYTDPE